MSPSTKPSIADLDTELARAIKLWVKGVGQKAVFGLWLHGAPRAGTSYAARAALTQLGSIDYYNHRAATVLDTYGAYQDLHAIWDEARLLSGNTSDAGLAADVAALEDEVAWQWKQDMLLLDDWSPTTPVDFFVKHFYPRVRQRILSGLPTVIASRYAPDVTGPEAQFFYDEFVVAEVTRTRAGR